MKTLEELEAKGYRMVETTANGTGYPEQLQYALIGFDTFDEAEKLAKENDLDIISIMKRDGWKLWYREGTAFGPYEITAESYGDDYTAFTNNQADDFFEEEVKPFLENFDSFEEIEDFLKEKKELLEKIETADDDEIVIACQGRYYDTVHRQMMQWSEDSKTYAIALIERD